MPQDESAAEDAISLPREEEEEEEEEEEIVNEVELCNPSDNGASGTEEEPPVDDVIDEVPNNSQTVVVDTSPVALKEEGPKKSYASIVSILV